MVTPPAFSSSSNWRSRSFNRLARRLCDDNTQTTGADLLWSKSDQLAPHHRQLSSGMYHPAARHLIEEREAASATKISEIVIPTEKDSVTLQVGGREVKLTNVNKVFWPARRITKGDLLRYYVSVAKFLLPYLVDRAMVMKRYPNGIEGEFFFMERAASPRPDWIEICSIEHASGNIIGVPVISDLASLLWVINLGCIDLNPWYARCDDVHRPDFLHFDLDPVRATPFSRVIEAAFLVRTGLDELKMPSYVKTSGSRGLHVYVPIARGPLQHNVWMFAKAFARKIAAQNPRVLTAEYRKDRRPAGRVLVDYNQNAWGQTLASVYSARPVPSAAVSTPVTWEELGQGLRTDDFRIDNVPERTRRLGDLWRPLLRKTGRVSLERYL